MSDMMRAQAPIQQALDRLALDMEVPECHGHLVGWLCASGNADADTWLAQLDITASSADLLAEEARHILGELFKYGLAQLNDPELGFQPLLGGEERALSERLDALGAWTQGFLLGMSEGGCNDINAMPADCSEIMRDLVEISGVERYELSDSEQDEAAYVELLEYIRTGVLLINEELNPTRAAPVEGQTLH